MLHCRCKAGGPAGRVVRAGGAGRLPVGVTTPGREAVAGCREVGGGGGGRQPTQHAGGALTRGVDRLEHDAEDGDALRYEDSSAGPTALHRTAPHHAGRPGGAGSATPGPSQVGQATGHLRSGKTDRPAPRRRHGNHSDFLSRFALEVTFTVKWSRVKHSFQTG